MAAMLQTPLTAWHKTAQAKMAPFAGWEMPIQYEGILAEHTHTRTQASLFDICHMGEVLISGPDAGRHLAACVTHNLATLRPGRCRYGFLLNPDGGVVDDLIIYHLRPDFYMAVLNASRTRVDAAALRDRLPDSVTLTDISDQTAKIDLQGPKSFEAFSEICRAHAVLVDYDALRGLPYFGVLSVNFNGAELLVSRTGYTGEFGYELYAPADLAVPLWEACLGNPLVKPAGLGARDTLRLEAGLLLYGQDIDADHTPAEAGYGEMLGSEADYVGKGADLAIRSRLTPLRIEGRRSARHGDAVLLPGSAETLAGVVTSGSFSPSLEACIALAYVDAALADADMFVVRTARVDLPARKTGLPFYTKGTARMKL